MNGFELTSESLLCLLRQLLRGQTDADPRQFAL